MLRLGQRCFEFRTISRYVKCCRCKNVVAPQMLRVNFATFRTERKGERMGRGTGFIAWRVCSWQCLNC